jgi:hypothetical protein
VEKTKSIATKSIETLLRRTDCKIVCKAAFLLEDAEYEDPDLVYLKRLPVFKERCKP